MPSRRCRLRSRYVPTVRLSEFPWVVVRLDCKLCPRKGQYRLARLVARVGDPEMDLEHVLELIAIDCPLMRPGAKPRKYVARCGIRFTDLDGRRGPPPDLPPRMVRLKIVGGRDAGGES